MSFFKKINELFNNKKPEPVVQSQQNFQTKKINFENPNVLQKMSEKKVIKMNVEESDLKIQAIQDLCDTRYQSLVKENIPTLKECGLTINEIEQGEVPVMVQKKFVFFKMQSGKYQEVFLIETNYKLCISPISTKGFIFFPLGKIQKLNKYTNNENAFKLLIVLKDARKFKFRINAEATWKRIYEKIEQFAFIKVKPHFFAFKRFQANPKLQETYKGWELYNPIKQFERMKIKLMPHTEGLASQFPSQFKILDNRDGKICTTYPKILIVPSRMPYDYLVRCAKFRSRNRMPALTYAYQYEKGKFSSIYRSSQSKVGVQNSRCFEDQLMLRCIGDHFYDPKNETPFVGSPDCKIYDARNYIAALGNKFSGKGYESSEFYKNIEIEFLNIPNIHAVRQSYNKVLKAAAGEDFKFHTNLAQSQWYDYVFLILAGAVQISRNLIKGINNLVHCSDGWDRTAQLCALSAMMLDPFYRTIQGFQILIQKDWIHFGHQFSTRMGQGMNNPSSEEKSQVFLQFLDCVSQMLYQFPSDFEFNYKLLQEIGELAYSHLFGNFLCNCQLQMERVCSAKKTVSLWSYVAAHRQKFLNPFYIPGQPGRILQVSSAQKNMRFFKQHFLQHIEQFKDVYEIYSCNFTDDNLEIMHRQLLKQKVLLQERFKDNQNLLMQIDGEILKRVSSDDKGQVLEKQKEQEIIDQLINKCENQEKEVLKEEQRLSELKQAKSRKNSRNIPTHKGKDKKEQDSDSDNMEEHITGEYQGKIVEIDPDQLPQEQTKYQIEQTMVEKKQEKVQDREKGEEEQKKQEKEEIQ